jgi:4-aminobutyrate aminotransferase / (S)-3-amino-2-methylpropionate transaminase / 5-aminovalerate transaminase
MDTIQKYKEFVNTSCVKAVEPIVIEKAKGAVYTDINGKEFIDGFAGISVVNSGHCNPEVIAAAKAQMDKLVHCCSYVYYSQPTADLAEKLAQITPGKLKKTFFANSGAEAIEGAMRLAKQFTNKFEFVSLTHSFHGRSLATLSITGNSARKKGGGPFLPGIAFAPSPYCYRCIYGKDPKTCGLECAKAVDDVIKFQTSNRVAAFVAESIMGEGGIIVPPPHYFEEVKKILDKYGALFMADEVQCGFGRTGKMFALEHYGVECEIMCMAKGIADGFPLSGFIAREDVAAAFTPGDHLTTFGGNPISCAAALANIAFMEREKLPEQALKKGERLMEKLRKLTGKKAQVGDVRGKGLMVGVELIKDDKKTPASDEAGALRKLCRERGVLLGVGGVAGNVMRIQPPLVISEDQLDKIVNAMQESLNAL